VKALALVIGLGAAFELLWASHGVLRAHRAHFRAMVLLFWGLTLLLRAGDAWGLLPSHLYFNDVPRFASDAVTYQLQATYVADGLRSGSIVPYLDWQVFNYSRVLGLLFYLFDNSPLAGGLFNVTFYMASVLSVFLLARRLFDDRAGLWAAWLAACWPVFLLYETQTLRWVTTTAGLHLLMVSTVVVMGRDRVYLAMLSGLAGFAILLVDLPQFARIAFVVAFAQALVLAVADLRARAWPARALRVAFLASVMFAAYDVVWVRGVGTPATLSGSRDERGDRRNESARDPLRRRPPASGQVGQIGLPEHLQIPSPRSVLDRLVAPILATRSGYLNENEELRKNGISVGTTLAGPPLTGVRDFALNLPAALASAILAPTPAALLRAGPGASQLGRYVAVEMIAYYALLGLMCAGLWQSLRGNSESMLATGYILIFTAVAYVIVGTVAMNGGTLHRFRLPFVVLHMVYAAPVLARWVPAMIDRMAMARR